MEKFCKDADGVVVIVTERNMVRKTMYACMAMSLLKFAIKDHGCTRTIFNGVDCNGLPFTFDVGLQALAVYVEDVGDGETTLNVVFSRHHVRKSLLITAARGVLQHAQNDSISCRKTYNGHEDTRGFPFKFEVGDRATSVYAG